MVRAVILALHTKCFALMLVYGSQTTSDYAFLRHYHLLSTMKRSIASYKGYAMKVVERG